MSDYNIDGYYIMDRNKWKEFSKDMKKYRRQKRKAWLWLLIPMFGFIISGLIFEEMGLSFI